MKFSELLLFILVWYCYTHFVTSQMITIIGQPQSQSVCEGGTASFICIVMFPSGTLPRGATWFTDNDVDVGSLSDHDITDDSNGRSAPANVTSMLTVIDVNINDNGTSYICGIIVDLTFIRSNTSFLTIAPPTVPTIIPTPLTSTSFTVSWTITNPDHNYIVTWTNLRTGMMSSVTVPGNTNSYMVTGLNGIDNYNVSVTANTSCGMMMSDPATVYDVPSGVMNVRIRDDITNESFVVLWDEVMDIFTITYNVTWYNDSGIIGMDTVNSPTYTVTGLTAITSYNVTVVAINTCCGAGPVSVPVEAITNMRESTSSPTHSPGDSSGDGDDVITVVTIVIVAVMAICAI